MRVFKFTSLFIVGALIAAAYTAQAQKETEGRLDLALSYQAMRSNPVGGSNFWLQSGSMELHGQFWRGLGAVAEISGFHQGNVDSTGVSLDIVTATFGPRYTWFFPHSRLSVYGQALAGEAFGFNSVFPGVSSTTANANNLAFELGGGVNYTLDHHLSLRALQADWLRTQLPNAAANVQNNLRLGAGLVLHFK